MAQTGSLKGYVKDKSTGEPLVDVNVFIPSIKKGAVTEFEGDFLITDIPAGKYKVIFNNLGYKSDTAYNVLIKAGETTLLERTMDSDTTNQVEVVIVGQKNEGSELTAVQDTKESEKIISVLSTEQILKGQDRDAAEAVRRIPGVSIIENRFIMVRGLAQRYNTVWMNDAGAPSLETDSKAFSFDLIPSQLIDKIQVYKTAAPDLPGDFAGGMVKIYTRASATQKTLQINLQESYRPGSTFNDFNFTAGSPLDFLGLGKGYRNIPSGVPSTNLDKYSLADRITYTQDFKNTWQVHNRKALPDMRLNIFYTNRYKLSWVDIGNTFNLNYANLNTVFKIHRMDWNDTVKTHDYNDVQSTNTARLGLVENFSFVFNKNFKMEFRNIFSQVGVQQNTLRSTNSSFLYKEDIKYYALSYESRTIYSTQLTGTLNSKNENREYTWAAGYSYINRAMPDLRRIKYSRPPGEDTLAYAAQVSSGTADPNNGGGRFYSNLNENIESLNQNLKQKITIKNYSFETNIGAYVEHKARAFKARELGYANSSGNFTITQLPLGQLFASQNIGKNGFHLDEITNPYDQYTAQNILLAPYLSVSAPILKKIKVLTGVRAEYNRQGIQSFLSTTQRIDTTAVTFFLLPSANVSYNFTEKSLVRFAYGRTLNRPEFREWAPFYFYDFEFNAGTYGSLFPSVLSPKGTVLKVATIDNYDIRYEFYPSAGELINIGVFYKKFTNPIQRVVLNGTDDSRSFTFSNAQTAYVAGIELDVRKNLEFIGGSRLWKNLNLVANASLIKSQVSNTNVINADVKTPLQGQSPYLINSGFYYQDDSSGWQASLIYNVFGPRVYLYGTKDYPSWIEMPRNTLDLTISKTLSERVQLSFGIQDILNQPVLLVQDTDDNGKYVRPESQKPAITKKIDHLFHHKAPSSDTDKIIKSYRPGSYFTCSIKFNLF